MSPSTYTPFPGVSSQDAEDVLAGALERLRSGRALPDELLRDP